MSNVPTGGQRLQEIRANQDAGAGEPEALQVIAGALLTLGRPIEARRAAATQLLAERKTYGYAIAAYGMLARAQLTLAEPPSEIERTLAEYAAAIEHTGMCVCIPSAEVGHSEVLS